MLSPSDSLNLRSASFCSFVRLRGKGIPVLNGRGRGDQYVTVTVETPRNLTKEQKEALRRFSESLGESNYEKRKSFFKKK